VRIYSAALAVQRSVSARPARSRRPCNSRAAMVATGSATGA
jgi:hypothetical protein